MPKMSAVKGKWALITGASRGLGLALARECALKGYDLVLISRNNETLEKAARSLKEEGGSRVETLSADLSSQKASFEIAHFLREKKIMPEMWINNAGAAFFGRFREGTEEKDGALLNLNVHSATQLTRLALTVMKRGFILNVASTAAFAPGPGAALYYASKGFEAMLTLAIAEEEANGPLSVSLLCPGPLNTDMLKERGEKGKRAAFFVMSPQKAACYALKKTFKGKKVIIPGLINRIMVLLARDLPLMWIVKIIRRSNLG